ncbi:SO_0444 family Cu/Zn efflux transporter [Nitrosophilus alvini]|uniref:SO_0444 family Cu/Zn efflux transporter n=1 Tax=Nitrosophilus alvini TaxID=2714855 RepID=UPI00190A7F19|nr:SO_0444 family Cu/Zn efflux transporter [Nitrosophilus alvini]
MQYLEKFFENFISLADAMSIYILVGLFAAGILHELIPENFVKKHLGSKDTASVLKASLFGIPLPLCSCSVIPFISALKKEGASKGAIQSFLISTPITGIDSILATYGIFGFLFTIYRVITSLIVALAAGIIDIFIEKENPQQSEQKPVFTVEKPTSQSCCSGCEDTKIQKKFSFADAFKYGFKTLFSDIAKPLFWGLVLGALIASFIPENLSEFLKENIILSYIVALIISLPMYVCATASLPIAASLILAGVSPGAAFVFLSAGPATNSVTIGVVYKLLGKKSLLVYLGTIIAGSIVFGIVFDWFFYQSGMSIENFVHMNEEAGLMSRIATVILLVMIFKSFFKKSKAACCSS